MGQTWRWSVILITEDDISMNERALKWYKAELEFWLCNLLAIWSWTEPQGRHMSVCLRIKGENALKCWVHFLAYRKYLICVSKSLIYWLSSFLSSFCFLHSVIQLTYPVSKLSLFLPLPFLILFRICVVTH